jgi:undecaprenyl-diphosphatase
VYSLQLEWIHHLQAALRSPCMDRIFRAWNYVDSLYFMMPLILLIWFLVNRKVGVRLLYIFLLSGIVNKILKILFSLPRPCHIDPSVGLVCYPDGGLPSGAAQTALLLAGVIFIESKSRLFRILGILFALVLCFSRIYLGLHFVTDILGGLLVGGCLLMIYWKLFPLFEKHWRWAVCLAPLVFLLIGQSRGYYFAVISLGVGLGLLLAEKNEVDQFPTHLPRRVIQFVLALMGVIGLEMVLASYIPKGRLLFSFLGSFWLSFCAPWLSFQFQKAP